jgi:CBS domain-containing protein/ribosome-associated translation inhibitor RaiA
LMESIRELALSEISEIAHGGISVFRPDETVSRVLGVLRESGRYEAAVTSDEAVGIITVRDLLGVSNPSRAKIASVWRATGSVGPSASVLDVVDVLMRDGIRAIPVTSGGEIESLASQMDIIGAMCEVSELSEVTAKDLVLSPVIAVDREESVSRTRKLMLERDISHIPVIDKGRLSGEVTADAIVHTYITPASKTTTGDRVGERAPRFPGKAASIMDRQPLAVGPDASAKRVVCGMRDHRKGACYVTSGDGGVLGIITPRELMGLIARLRAEEELPVYIMGLSDEDFFERSIAEDKVRRVVERGMRFRPDINEVSVRIKRSQKSGERARYGLTARALSPSDQVISEAEGWDLLETFDELCSTLERALRRTKQEPPRQRRGRGRR